MLGPRTHSTPQAFARELYAAYSDQILAFFWCMHGMSTPDAVDLLQQTFVELLSSLNRRPNLYIEHPRAFLFKIASRQLTQALARTRRRTAAQADANTEHAHSGAEAEDLERLATLRADQRRMLRALRRLSIISNTDTGPPGVSEDQILLYLRFWAGLALVEVADVLGMTTAAVSGRQRRALARLRRGMERLGDLGAEPGATSTRTLRRWHDALARAAREREKERAGP